jgi:quercetin dioxygenase-like cupin family protein
VSGHEIGEAAFAMAPASEPINAAGMTIQFLVEAEESSGSVSVFRCDVPVGSRVPAPHSHDAFDETVYGLGGVTTFTVEGVPTKIGPGDVLHIPRGAVRGFAVGRDGDASILCIATPGLLGAAYFREMAGVIDAAAGGPPDREAIFAVMKRHGLTPARSPEATAA